MRALAAVALAALALGAAGCAPQLGHVLLAQSDYREGDYVGALHWAELAIARGDDGDGVRVEAYSVKAQALERLNRTNEAAGLYEYLVHVAGDRPAGELARQSLDAIGPVCPVSR
jgi:tetratricopeptide (TPR) repeat protein